MINFKKLEIPDVLLIEPKIFYDERGYFFESFNQNDFNKAVGQKINFVQDNHSSSKMGVLRGLHYQEQPFEQGKLVRVIKGEVWDVAVDIRRESPTYGHWVAETLSSDNNKQLWIPEGFAHGFIVLSDTAVFLYKTTNYYRPESEITINWQDRCLNINWPNIQKVISKKDQQAISFHDFNELKK